MNGHGEPVGLRKKRKRPNKPFDQQKWLAEEVLKKCEKGTHGGSGVLGGIGARSLRSPPQSPVSAGQGHRARQAHIAPPSVTLSERNPATLVRKRRCSGQYPESEGLHASRIMAVTADDRPAWPRWRAAGLAWALCMLVLLGLTVTPWLNQQARHAGRSDLGSDANTVVYGLVAVSAATVGAVLAGRRPRHPVGWLLLGLGLWFVYGYASWVLLAWRGAPPAVGSAVLDANVVVIPALVGFVLLLTPTGTLPSRRWRWWARAAAAAPVVGLVSLTLGPFRGSGGSVANTLAVPSLAAPLLVVRAVAFVVAGLAIPVGAWSLVVRFGRARGVERQQLRWLAVAAAPVAVAVAALATQALTGNQVDLGWLVGVCLAVLPLAIGAAVLRYRLYDLDRIVSRTLAYGLLTLLLGGGYAGVVLGLGQLLPNDSNLGVATATLAVAALFRPARRRVQAAVDRRFNRRRYDAAQTIQGFSTRLRQQVDLDTLTAELLAVIEQTMQPTRVSLWLRPPPPAPNGSANPVADGAGAQRRQ
jgi:hypothetical protein